MDKAQPGSKLRGHLSARLWNSMVDAARDYERRQLSDGGRREKPRLDTSMVMVRNESGANRNAGEALEIGDFILDSADIRREYLWFSAAARTGNGLCGVLPYPLPNNKIGPLQIAGVCIAYIDANDADNTHVYVDASVNPQGNFGGPWKIVWKPAGTGGMYAILDLGSPLYERKAITAASISPGGHDSVDVLINGSTVGSVTAWWNHMEAGGTALASGTDVLIRWYDDEQKWVIVGAECA